MIAGDGTPPEVRAAYRHCELVTRRQARNFAYGILLLPGAKRRALSAVYAFARRIDDIGDGTLPAQAKLAELTRARSVVQALAAAGGAAADGAGTVSGPVLRSDPVLIALADAARRFPIPVAAFGELIDGCEADVRGTSYATFADLEHYCRCVAGSIGRLSLGVFGSSDPARARPLADALGVALQLTNILRDVREDLANGRVYLPAEDLERFGCALTAGRAASPGGSGQGLTGGPAAPPGGGKLADLIRFEGERARRWYATGAGLMPLLDRRSAASAGAMAGIYLRLLNHICADPDAALGRRVSLPASQKAMVAARALTGMASPRRRTPAQAAGARP